MSIFLGTMVIRGIQVLLEAAPTLLCGVVFAGLLRHLVKPDYVRRLFARTDFGGLVKASFVGMLIPVGSLGVLPILRELRRLGARTPNLLSFALAAPMLNPITLVYGLTVLRPPIFLLLVAVTLLVSLAVGGLTNRWSTRERTPVEDVEPTRSSSLRLVNSLIASARLCAGPTALDVLLVMVVTGLAAAFVPIYPLTSSLKYTDPWAPPLMALVAFPAYVSPAMGVVQMGAISSIQFSLGAAVAIHVFGVGLNVILPYWVARIYGVRRAIALGFVVIAATLALGYASDAIFEHPLGSEQDTHALDQYGQVRHLLAPERLWQLLEEASIPVYVALGTLLGLLVTGTILRLTGTERLKESPAAAEVAHNDSIWNKQIPQPWPSIVGVVSALAVVVMLIYVYYPPVEELFDEMSSVRANAISAYRVGTPELARQEFQTWDYLAGKLPIAAVLRRGSVSAEARTRTGAFRDMLARVRDSVGTTSKIEKDKLIRELTDSYSECREAYRAAGNTEREGAT
ncbi:putative permease [Planctomycetes bacterium Pan216]|uniref:Putative permease n=1 Tax=Kolteria novifilia TaxID=2527975 RepID=A0A518BBD6_9BACT|nr:putative permease [Planctomycetes bacterium Pan216]